MFQEKYVTIESVDMKDVFYVMYVRSLFITCWLLLRDTCKVVPLSCVLIL